MTGLENVGVRSKRKERKHYDEHQDYVELGSTYWCVLRREFSGMIHWLSINPSNPQQPIQQSTIRIHHGFLPAIVFNATGVIGFTTLIHIIHAKNVWYRNVITDISHPICAGQQGAALHMPP